MPLLSLACHTSRHCDVCHFRRCYCSLPLWLWNLKNGSAVDGGFTTGGGRMATRQADRRKHHWALLVLLFLLLAGVASADKKLKAPPKPTNEECLACHGDAGLTTERDGKPGSLDVNPH